MEMGDIEIGISGLGVGSFPDQDKVGGLIRQWRLLPLAKALGFSEEALTNYIVEFLGLFSGTSVNDFAKKFRNDFLPQWTDGLLMAPSQMLLIITSPLQRVLFLVVGRSVVGLRA